MPAPVPSNQHLGFDSAGSRLDAGMLVNLCHGTQFYNYAKSCGLEVDGLFWLSDENLCTGDVGYAPYPFPSSRVNGLQITCDDSAMMARARGKDVRNINRTFLQGSDLLRAAPPVTCSAYEADRVVFSTSKQASDHVDLHVGDIVGLSLWGYAVLLDLIREGLVPDAAKDWEYSIVWVAADHVICQPSDMGDCSDLAQKYGSNALPLNFCDLVSTTVPVQKVPSLAHTNVLCDKKGDPLTIGDVVTLDINFIRQANPALASVVHAQDEFYVRVPPMGTPPGMILLRSVDASVDGAIMNALGQYLTVMATNTIKKQAAPMVAQLVKQPVGVKQGIVDRQGRPLQVGDYVTIDKVVLNAMPSLSSIISVQDEFELSSTLPGSAADFVLLAVDPRLRAAVQAVRQPLEAVGHALLLSGAGANKKLASAAYQSGHPPMDHNGAIISVGDIVKLTPAAAGTWGVYLSIDPTEEFEIEQFSHIASPNYITLKALDPVRHARYIGLLKSPIYVEEGDIEFVRSSYGFASGGHYAPVLADSPLTKDPETGEKYFDHASLGTDLSGDELMKTVRDFCEGNGYV